MKLSRGEARQAALGTIVAALLCSIALAGGPGDLDNDGDVDKSDLAVLLEGRGDPADGPSDPRDLDGDGTITVLDARQLALLCTRPLCQTEAELLEQPAIVFVSSRFYSANLHVTRPGPGEPDETALENADEECQLLADASSLIPPGRRFKAWLSQREEMFEPLDPILSPSTGFVQRNTPYVLVDGTQIAPNWAGLIDGSLDAPLNMDENGVAGLAASSVWTGTRSNGEASEFDCRGWIDNHSYMGTFGLTSETGPGWTEYSVQPCQIPEDVLVNGGPPLTRRIYCFQQ